MTSGEKRIGGMRNTREAHWIPPLLACWQQKSRYHWPTARKVSGVKAQTILSTSASSSAQVEGAATGTATTICAADVCLRVFAATRIDDPVAKPSSTRMAVPPLSSNGGRLSRYSRSLRIQSWLFSRDHSVNDLVGNAERLYDISVQHSYPAGSQGSHGELLLTWRSQFSYHKDIERCVQCLCYFVSHRNASAGQREDNNIIPSREFLEPGSEPAPALKICPQTAS